MSMVRQLSMAEQISPYKSIHIVPTVSTVSRLHIYGGESPSPAQNATVSRSDETLLHRKDRKHGNLWEAHDARNQCASALSMTTFDIRSPKIAVDPMQSVWAVSQQCDRRNGPSWSGNLAASPRCSATTRSGTVCRAPAMWSKRTGRY